jgi:sporulation protein YlmC with PRC-barrel domain
MHIPINARLMCTDGLCGRVMAIIVEPDTDQVTHLVVRTRHFPAMEVLVPLGVVTKVSDDAVQIDRSSAKLAHLERFTEIEYVNLADPEAAHAALEGSYAGHIKWAQARPGLEMLELGTQDVPVEHELVPEGEMALHRGSHVVASDGRRGVIEELLIDPHSGEITHLIMQDGHLWAKHERTVPVSEIERIEDDTIYLRPSRQAHEAQDAGARTADDSSGPKAGA